MLASEIIFNVKNLKSGGIQSDDARLSDEQVLYIFGYYRARFVEQRYRRTSTAIIGVEQNLGKVNVDDLTEDATGSGLAIPNWMLSDTIPSPILLPDGPGLTYVGTVDGEVGYTEIKRNRAQLIKHARYTADEGYWYLHGDRIAIKLEDGASADNIGVIGVFDDPVKALEFPLVPPAELDLQFNYNYPVTAKDASGIYLMMSQSELPASVILPSDNVNDSIEDQTVNATSQ